MYGKHGLGSYVVVYCSLHRWWHEPTVVVPMAGQLVRGIGPRKTGQPAKGANGV